MAEVVEQHEEPLREEAELQDPQEAQPAPKKRRRSNEDEGAEGERKEKKRKKEKKRDKKEKKEKKEKKRRRPAGSKYIDEAAELSGEELGSSDEYDSDVDEEPDEELKEFIETGHVKDRFDHRAFEMEREMQEMEAKAMAAEKKYEEEAKAYDELYQKAQQEAAERGVHVDVVWDEWEMKAAEEAARAEMLARPLPGLQDPRLFVFKVDPGTENDCVLAVLRRFVQLRDTQDRLFITSCFTTPASKGFIYIEAEKEVHARRAIQGISAIKWWSQKLVRIEEMVQAVTVAPAQVKPLKEGDFVRMRLGVYKDDVAQVVRVMDQGSRLLVRLIPRLDYTEIQQREAEKLQAEAEDEEEIYVDEDGKKRRRKKKRRPPPPPRRLGARRPMARLFDPDEISGGGVKRVRAFGGMWVDEWAGMRFKHGFLLKEVTARSVDVDCNPTLDEREKFKSGLHDDIDEDQGEKRPQDPDDLAIEEIVKAAAQAADVNAGAKFQKGDRIVVIAGDLKGLTGVVQSVFRNTVKVQPESLVQEPIEFEAREIRKYFRLGDQVRITTGQWKGETGFIVNINEKDDTVVIFADGSQRQLVVRMSDIVESTAQSAGREKLGDYQLYDLIAISGHGDRKDVVGVIVRVDINSVQVLTNKGLIITVSQKEISRKLSSRQAHAMDANRNQLSLNDNVRVLAGPHKDMQGSIKHIWRNCLWLYSRLHPHNSNIFLAQARQCVLVGQPTRRVTAVPASPQLDGGRRYGEESLRYETSPPYGGTPGYGAPRGPRPLQGLRADPLFRKMVVIKKGVHKGKVGLVVNIADQMLTIDLEANEGRRVSVHRDNVKLKEYTAPRGYDEMLGAQTPLIGSRTPGWVEGGMTPWQGDGGMTPAYRTPMHGAMTPSHDVWNPRTPHHQPDYGGGADEAEDEEMAGGLDYTRFSSRTGPEDYEEGSEDTVGLGLPQTPGRPVPHTPYSAYTPAPATPAAYPQTPITPGTGIPRTPGAPAPEEMAAAEHDLAGMEEGAEDAEGGAIKLEIGKAPPRLWQPGVRVRSRADRNMLGTVVAVEGPGVRFRVKFDNGSVQSLPESQLWLVAPEKGCTVLVLDGEAAGQQCTLLGVDNDDGIVKSQVDNNIAIVQLSQLAAYADPNA